MKPELASENKGFCSGSTIAACCSASAIITLPTVPGANPGFPLCWTFSCVELQSLQPACRLLAGPSLCGLGLVPLVTWCVPWQCLSLPWRALLQCGTAGLGVCLLTPSHNGSVVMGELRPCRCGTQEAVREGRQAHS